MALPPPEVRQALVAALEHDGLAGKLGRAALFPPANWHQTLSLRSASTAEAQAALLRAGARIGGTAFTLVFDRLKGASRGDSTCHWAFKAQRPPAAFRVLVDQVARAMRAEGFDAQSTPTPHVTVSYDAPLRIGVVAIEPVAWHIDAVSLVEGGGVPYRYEVLHQWPLAPARPGVESQLDLF